MTIETNGGWIEQIPAVDIELLDNGTVRVTDKSCFDQDFSVDLHPIHLRLIAERLGLAREMSASEADALRTVDKLARRLRLLHGRIEQMHKWLSENKDFEQADITVEYWYSDATLDLANEFIAEVKEAGTVVTPMKRSERDQGNAVGVTTAAEAVGGSTQAARGGSIPGGLFPEDPAS